MILFHCIENPVFVKVEPVRALIEGAGGASCTEIVLEGTDIRAVAPDFVYFAYTLKALIKLPETKLPFQLPVNVAVASTVVPVGTI